MSGWHALDCNQITNDNPTCRCMQIDYHVGAFKVALYLGLTKGVDGS